MALLTDLLVAEGSLSLSGLKLLGCRQRSGHGPVSTGGTRSPEWAASAAAVDRDQDGRHYY